MSLADVVPGCRSGRQLVAALTSTGGQDGATGAGTHPQAEAVGLGPATVVGLKGALAHGYLSTVVNCWCGAARSPQGNLRHGSRTAQNGRTEPTQFRVRTVRRDGQTRQPRPAAADYRDNATRRRRCLQAAWSCGKCRKVVSVRLARLGTTESPGATIPRRRGFSAARAVAVPTSPHMWITVVDGGRGPIAARGNIE